MWTDLPWLVLDIGTPDGETSLDGVFGSDMLTSGWFHAFFSPGQPDGHINQLHMDFREIETSGTAKVHFDLNPAVDNVIVPGLGIIVRQSFRTTDVGEGGDTLFYWVALSEQPASSTTWVQFEDTTGQAAAEKANNPQFPFENILEFNSSNWNTPQQIALSAVDDTIKEGPHEAAMIHTVLDLDKPLDLIVGAASLTVNITDNDLGEVVITHSDGSTELSEAGATDSYEISLNMVPSGVVEITVAADEQTRVRTDGGLTYAASQVLGFTDSTPQTIVVQAIDDAVVEDTHFATITHAISGAVNDSRFSDALTIGSVLAMITDNDSAGLTITSQPPNNSASATSSAASSAAADMTIALSEAGDDAMYWVRLNSQPRAEVTVSSWPTLWPAVLRRPHQASQPSHPALANWMSGSTSTKMATGMTPANRLFPVSMLSRARICLGLPSPPAQTAVIWQHGSGFLPAADSPRQATRPTAKSRTTWSPSPMAAPRPLSPSTWSMLRQRWHSVPAASLFVQVSSMWLALRSAASARSAFWKVSL